MLRASLTREVFFHERVNLQAPQDVETELRRHVPMIADRSGRPKERIQSAADVLLASVVIRPRPAYKDGEEEAIRLVGHVDADDVPFVVLALATGRPLWTQDRRMLSAPRVPTVTTIELASCLGLLSIP